MRDSKGADMTDEVARGEAWRVDGESAYIAGPCTDALLDALALHRPSQVELAADWPTLAPLAVVGDQLTALTVTAVPVTGKTGPVAGLEALPALRTLEISGKPRGGLQLAGLPLLERLHLHWQRGAEQAFALPMLRHLTLRGYGPPDLASVPAGSSLSSLWLANTGIGSLRGLERLERLADLRISRARDLATLDGLQRCPLQTLDVDDARALAEVQALAGMPLTGVWLRHVCEGACLSMLPSMPNIETWIVAGPRAPLFDWQDALAHPRLRKVAGWWRPDELPESTMRAMAAAGRRITRFDAAPGRDLRHLVVEMA